MSRTTFRPRPMRVTLRHETDAVSGFVALEIGEGPTSVLFRTNRKRTPACPGACSCSPERCGPLPAAACAAAPATGCAKQPARETLSLRHKESSPIIQGGAIHTPVAIGTQGCVLYSIEMPGGQALATLVYRRDDGSFSHARPQRCEETEEERGRQSAKSSTCPER